MWRPQGVRPVHRCGFSPRRCVPLPPPADPSGESQRAGPARLSIARQIIPVNYTRGGAVERWRCGRVPETARTCRRHRAAGAGGKSKASKVLTRSKGAVPKHIGDSPPPPN
ncbi:hypothetical protein NDU88_006191 [Pleurodeles waltl]|uniref:Uncharacterized protein n=1 Tax=Pleurodeles waltl TaxID=8319 RepID=A0AAV7VPT3_PLEWA|nr:hypothetical protein NDU88_006191 [Pleurodeles waltl]